jgi:cysteine synthase A
MPHPERHALYDELRGMVGRTDLTELTRLGDLRGSRIFLKHEFENPTGSHYDRIMVEVLYARENAHADAITPGMTLLDTTTGNSGAALAWLGGILGYESLIILPKDAPHARAAQIESLGGRIRYSPAGEYTDGLLHELKTMIRARPWTEFDAVLDHAANQIGPPIAMHALGREIQEQFASKWPGEPITHVIVALGNGASVHLAKPLKAGGTRVIGFEPLRAPTHFVAHYSHDELRARYGEPPPFSVEHGLWGTGAGSDGSFKWPLMRAAWHLIDDVELVTEAQWVASGTDLAVHEGLHVGRSTGAGVAVARRLAETLEEPANIVCIAYDAAWKYLE